MKSVCVGVKSLKAVDISHYQRHLDWAALKATGIALVIAKATEGAHTTDDMYASHISNARAFGLGTGAYHFFHPGIDAKVQAQHFCSVALGQNLLVLDWETTNGVPQAFDLEQGMTFLETVESMTKRVPMIYGSPYFLEALKLDERFKRFPLWIAHYGAKCPLVPAPWDSWAIWQYSDANGFDHNLFNGSAEDLKAFVG